MSAQSGKVIPASSTRGEENIQRTMTEIAVALPLSESKSSSLYSVDID